MKIKIKIFGPKVHNVGFRPFLIALADEFGFSKFEVYNSILEDDQVVIAKTESDEDQFQAFIDAIRSRKPKKAEVSDIKYEPFEGRVHSIMRTSMMSMTTQLAKGIDAIESTNEKMDQMLDKQDKNISILSGIDGKMDEVSISKVKCLTSKTKQPK
jgi:hydrogenase maturation factor HypF (carbamoyltransferase family)